MPADQARWRFRVARLPRESEGKSLPLFIDKAHRRRYRLAGEIDLWLNEKQLRNQEKKGGEVARRTFFSFHHKPEAALIHVLDAIGYVPIEVAPVMLKQCQRNVCARLEVGMPCNVEGEEGARRYSRGVVGHASSLNGCDGGSMPQRRQLVWTGGQTGARSILPPSWRYRAQQHLLTWDWDRCRRCLRC
jgi:hypothetical protein